MKFFKASTHNLVAGEAAAVAYEANILSAGSTLTWLAAVLACMAFWAFVLP